MHQINGFQVIEKLGEGGMASVWKARQISLDRIVAIKILSKHFSANGDDIRRFQDEAQAAAKLKHSGIVQVYDANAEDGTYYFIMEYVAGYTVGDWVRRKGVLSEWDALSVAECIADALAYAWDHAGIIHCDIKPDNIIIDEDGTVKVADQRFQIGGNAGGLILSRGNARRIWTARGVRCVCIGWRNWGCQWGWAGGLSARCG